MIIDISEPVPKFFNAIEHVSLY